MTNNEVEQISITILEKYAKRGGIYKQFMNIMQTENIKFKEGLISNTNFLGALTSGNNGQCYIVVNNSINNVGRKNFTIAHELGHYFLNHLQTSNSIICSGDDIAEETQVNKSIEHEANHFASCFLIPEQKIIKAFLGMLKYSKIAKRKDFLIVNNYTFGLWRSIRDSFMKRFGVSEEALRYRLRYLKLVQFGFDK